MHIKQVLLSTELCLQTLHCDSDSVFIIFNSAIGHDMNPVLGAMFSKSSVNLQYYLP